MHEATLYTKILESNLINFIIMISVLTLIFKKFKLGAIFDKMAFDIKTSVMTSAEAAEAALKEYKEAKRSTKNLDSVKDEIKNKAEAEAKRTKEIYDDLISKEKDALDVQFETKAKADTLKAKEETTKEFMDAVILLTKDEIQKRIEGENGGEIQSKIIDKCIADIDMVDFSGVKI